MAESAKYAEQISSPMTLVQGSPTAKHEGEDFGRTIVTSIFRKQEPPNRGAVWTRARSK
jgi:hypothetical protein